MVTEQPLAGRKILVTRPRAQSAVLVGMIARAGGEPILFPVIDIVPRPVTEWPPLVIERFDWLIFVSRNAVKCFVDGWARPLPEGLRLAAVGDGTAEAMIECGLRVDARPARSIGSEGLVQVAELQQLAGSEILIVRGNGGRELLAGTLTQRGANISYLEVYARRLPQVSATERAQALAADTIVCTSVAGVDNLCQLLGEGLAGMGAVPLVVLSERIRDHALAAGFADVRVAAESSDAAIMEQLVKTGE